MRTVVSLLASAAVATGLSESTAESSTMLQLQRRGKSQEAESKLGALQASARNMLKNGATPEVVTLSKETLQEIEDQVLPALEEAHATDKALLTAAFTKFANETSWFESKLDRIRMLETADETASQQHQNCRKDELSKQEDSEKCEQDLDTLWATYVATHSAFQRSGDGGLCESGWSTNEDEVDEDQYEAKYNSLVTLGQASVNALKAHQRKKRECAEKMGAHELQREHCDAKQTHLEGAKCQSYEVREVSNDAMKTQWAVISEIYADVRESVESHSKERQQEMDAIIEVRCLLRTIQERGGKACDDSEDGNVTGIIRTCQDEASNNDEYDMAITTDDAPSCPDEAVARPYPCQNAYKAAEYEFEYMTKLATLPECQPCDSVEATGTSDEE